MVHIAYRDAEAYATWAGKSLPTEAEWELAARGGLDEQEYAWGNEFAPGGVSLANTWQGEFPWQNSASDGWLGTSPVGAYPANGFGLFEMAGNTWEWCENEFQPGSGRRAMRGGSFLCHDSYCNRYRVAARSSNTPQSSASNIGLRVCA